MGDQTLLRKAQMRPFAPPPDYPFGALVTLTVLLTLAVLPVLMWIVSR